MEYVVTVTPQEVRGEMKIYSCPKSICTHVDWALSDIFQSRIELDWKPQQIWREGCDGIARDPEEGRITQRDQEGVRAKV